MTLRIGRVAFGDDERTRVGSLSFSGDTLSLNGEIKAVDQAKASAEMQRINGLIEGRDEPVVPLTWPDGPPDVSGFYRVTGGRVDGVGNYMSNGRAGFDLQLTRVSGFAAPMFEDRVIGGLRAGVLFESSSATALFALPKAARGVEIPENQSPDALDRISDTGDVTVFSDAAGSLFGSAPSFYLEPENWYDGACTLYVGGELQVGRQVRNVPGEWAITNGLVRYSASGGAVVMEKFRGGAWGEAVTIRPYHREDGVYSALEAPHTITVLFNGPQAVGVRLTYDAASAVAGDRFTVTLDIVLRRGLRVAAFDLHTRAFYSWVFAIEGWGTTWTSLDAGTANNGLVAGRDQYAGFTTGTPLAATTARITSVLETESLSAGIGYYGSGASGTDATGGESAQAVVNQWAAAQSERIDAVVR